MTNRQLSPEVEAERIRRMYEQELERQKQLLRRREALLTYAEKLRDKLRKIDEQQQQQQQQQQ